jgi:predicted ribosome quality control (RQC) complex YloA/Tae2 family protein
LLDDTFSGGSNEEIAARLVKTFTGISPFAARELALRSAGDPGRLKAEFRDMFDKVRGGEFAPVLITDDSGASIGFYAFPSVQHSASNQHERPSISEVADMYYTSALPKDALQQAKASLVGRLGRELESRKHALEEIQDGLRESGNAERLKQIGELILSQTASIPPETDSVGLVDYYDPNGATIRVELDPQLSAPENAEAYFRKYHKAVSGAEALRDRLAETETEIKLIRKALESADSITSEDEVDELARASAAQGIHIGRQDRVETEQRKAEFEGHKIARVNSSGWEILVGENSEANDYLLTRIARPSDWWLHVKASPSAHVVIRSNGKPETVPKSVLHAAAELAARHSDQKHSSLVPVDYTLRKYVRKPKGSPPGKAIYRGEKTIFLTPNP